MKDSGIQLWYGRVIAVFNEYLSQLQQDDASVACVFYRIFLWALLFNLIMNICKGPFTAELNRSDLGMAVSWKEESLQRP